ncbi:PTS sugar transporter subunit IIA [Vagococcus humatus]|uniref:PTS sugar transporter n=1 Tax=Vagococcus humatus TaxID=1889241 RepID=A0A3R9YCB5_9ENTE|nr:PTS sugar transporter subunit IIA [Vagococcus humatus]RST89084.1 PTS sugar transporter [Vagococcus humatus]
MKYATVISGHGGFATGMKASFNYISSIPEQYYFIDFNEGMSEKDLENKFLEIMNEEKQVLFFTDLLGGTPYKVAAQLAYFNENIEVVTGCNLSSLLESSFMDYNSIEDYANALVEISKNMTECFSLDELQELEDNTLSDGI